MSPTHSVLTVGHSTHSIDAFVDLLLRHQVTAIADVRSTPYSRFTPQFNREALAHTLATHRIRHVFLGHELGARSEDPSCYVDGRVQYSRLANTQSFAIGIERVLRGAEHHRIALMCAEKEPLDCHRTLLVARALSDRGLSIQHILADGRMEPHETTMNRLLDLVGLPRQELFRTRDQLLAEALAAQEERIAFVDPKLAAESPGESP